MNFVYKGLDFRKVFFCVRNEGEPGWGSIFKDRTNGDFVDREKVLRTWFFKVLNDPVEI